MESSRDSWFPVNNERYPQKSMGSNKGPSSFLDRCHLQVTDSYEAGIKHCSGLEDPYGKRKRLDNIELHDSVSRRRCESPPHYVHTSLSHLSLGKHPDNYGRGCENYNKRQEHDYPDHHQGSSSNLNPRTNRNVHQKFGDTYCLDRNININHESSCTSDELRRVNYSEEKDLDLKNYEKFYSRSGYNRNKDYELERSDNSSHLNLISSNIPYSSRGGYPKLNWDRDSYSSTDVQPQIYDNRVRDINKNHKLSSGGLQQGDNYDRLGHRQVDYSMSKNFDKIPEYTQGSSSKYTEPKGYINPWEDPAVVCKKTTYSTGDIKGKCGNNKEIYKMGCRDAPLPLSPAPPPPVIREGYDSSNIALSVSLGKLKKLQGDYDKVMDISRHDSFKSSVRDYYDKPNYPTDGRDDYNKNKSFGRSENFDDKRGYYHEIEKFDKFPSTSDSSKNYVESERYVNSARDDNDWPKKCSSQERGGVREDHYDRTRVIENRYNYGIIGRDDRGKNKIYGECSTSSALGTNYDRPVFGIRDDFGQSKNYMGPEKSWNDRSMFGNIGRDDFGRGKVYGSPIKSNQGVLHAIHDLPMAYSGPRREKEFGRGDINRPRNIDDQCNNNQSKGFSIFNSEIGTERDNYDKMERFCDNPPRNYAKPGNFRNSAMEDSDRRNDLNLGRFHGMRFPESGKNVHQHCNEFFIDSQRTGDCSFIRPSNDRYLWRRDQHANLNNWKDIKQQNLLQQPKRDDITYCNQQRENESNTLDSKRKGPLESQQIKGSNVKMGTGLSAIDLKGKRSKPSVSVCSAKTQSIEEEDIIELLSDDDDKDENDANPDNPNDDNIINDPSQFLNYEQSLVELKVDTVSMRDSGPLTLEKVKNIVGPCGKNMIVLFIPNENPLHLMARMKEKLKKQYIVENSLDKKRNLWVAKVILERCQLACETHFMKGKAKKNAVTLAIQRLREHYYTLMIKNNYITNEKMIHPRGYGIPYCDKSSIFTGQPQYISRPNLPRLIKIIDEYKNSDDVNDLVFSPHLAPKHRHMLKHYAIDEQNLLAKHLPLKGILIISKKIDVWLIVERLINKDPKFMEYYQLLPPACRK